MYSPGGTKITKKETTDGTKADERILMWLSVVVLEMDLVTILHNITILTRVEVNI